MAGGGPTLMWETQEELNQTLETQKGPSDHLMPSFELI